MQMVKTTSQPMHRYFNGCNCFDMNYSTTNIIMTRKRGKRLSLARPRLCFGSSLIMQKSLFFQEKFLLSSFLESSQHAEEQDVPGVPQKHLKLMHSIIYVIMQMVKISSQSAHTSLRL